jgi:hypothetical protein
MHLHASQHFLDHLSECLYDRHALLSHRLAHFYRIYSTYASRISTYLSKLLRISTHPHASLHPLAAPVAAQDMCYVSLILCFQTHGTSARFRSDEKLPLRPRRSMRFAFATCSSYYIYHISWIICHISMSVQPPAFAPSDHSNRPPPLRTTSTDHLRSSPPPLLNNTDHSEQSFITMAPPHRSITSDHPHRCSPPFLPTAPPHSSSSPLLVFPPPLLPETLLPLLLPITPPPHRSSPPGLPTDPHHRSSLLPPRSSPPPLTTTDLDHRPSPPILISLSPLPTTLHRSPPLPTTSYFDSPSDRLVHQCNALATCSFCCMHLHASQYFLDHLSNVCATATFALSD